jgi:hypothetical protein
MSQGYYTIEQWKQSKSGGPSEWVAIGHLPFGFSQTDAEKAVEQLNKPGLYRLVHMQRVIWADNDNGKVRLRKSHASSPESLARLVKMFERTGEKYPLDEVQAARQKAKRQRPH